MKVFKTKSIDLATVIWIKKGVKPILHVKDNDFQKIGFAFMEIDGVREIMGEWYRAKRKGIPYVIDLIDFSSKRKELYKERDLLKKERMI